ncbi:MAG: hypothetical protein J4215_01000 [Candidatus Diapherotrites archaeon]|uniref:Uncharacterized protein n=1 Tax=Candidatus Iainarchaeum sp. TaxID=3101447 RepID=A0A8T4L2Z5_9ARCH|nr:hypothetical protein [Candidatus Diapherotrites archaeon]
MRKVLLVLLILAAMATLNVNARTISQHLIEIQVDGQENTHISERYVFSFDNPTELETLRSEARRIGADIAGWRAFDQNIYAHIGQIRPGTGKIGFEEKEGDRYVKIEYETRDPLFTAVETTRRTTYQLDSRQLSAFQTGSVYTIQPNTKIVIMIPRNGRFDAEQINPRPEINFETNRFVWSGYLNTTGAFEFEYWIEKQIAPTITISQAIQTFLPKDEFKVLLAILLLGLGVIYFKRNSIQEKIEGYIIENSTPDKQNETEPVELE